MSDVNATLPEVVVPATPVNPQDATITPPQARSAPRLTHKRINLTNCAAQAGQAERQER
jgi:hypothetical protein